MERRETAADGGIARVGARITRIRQLRELTDIALIQAMRGGDSGAFHVFYERFSPALEACARSLRIPTMEWDVCVQDVLTDAAMRFTSGGATPPKQLVSYLRRMVRNAYAKRRRSALFQAKLAALAESEGDEPVLRALCGQSTLHAASSSRGADTAVTTQVLRALGTMLASSLNRDEQYIMGWVCMRIPYRRIADWIGVEYEATSKRIQRISRRLRELAIACYADLLPRNSARSIASSSVYQVWRLWRRQLQGSCVGLVRDARDGLPNQRRKYLSNPRWMRVQWRRRPTN